MVISACVLNNCRSISFVVFVHSGMIRVQYDWSDGVCPLISRLQSRCHRWGIDRQT
jgi:hypothetical protein